MGGVLDPTVRQLLTAYLGRHVAARERWPLWTYSRASGDWGDLRPETFVERLRFAHLWHVEAIERDLRGAAADLPGDFRLIGYTPGQPDALFFRVDSPEAFPPNVGPYRIRIPLVWQARCAAVFSALADPVPRNMDELRWPSRWKREVPFDDMDREQLDRALPGWRRSAGPLPWLPQNLPLVGHVADVQRQAHDVWADDEPRPVTSAEKKREQRSRRARAELLRERFGVEALAEGRTSHQTLLPPAIVARLVREARDFVPEVQRYEPSPDEVRLLFRLRQRDRELRGVDMDSLQWGRLRTGRANRADELELVCLRYPFLVRDEIQAIRTESGGPAALGKRLVRDRLPGSPSPRTLERISSPTPRRQRE